RWLPAACGAGAMSHRALARRLLGLLDPIQRTRPCMSDGEQPSSLVEVLDRLEEAAREQSDIALGAILEAVGRRSFGPLLLVAGLIALSPLSGIPGMPTTVGVLVLIIAVQLL